MIKPYIIKNLAEKYNTPYFVYDGNKIKENYLALKNKLHSNVELFYSLKANNNISIANLFHHLGSGIEVASYNELTIALNAGFSSDKIIFSGPGKTKRDLEYAIEKNIYCIIAESLSEVKEINEICKKKKTITGVGIRINPSIRTKKQSIQMGGAPRQFGIEENSIEKVISFIKTTDLLFFRGIHVYLGTQILDEMIIYDNFLYTLNLAKKISVKYNLNLEMINLGGGLGIKYFENDRELFISPMLKELNIKIKEFNTYFKNTKIIIESGRYLLAEFGLYVTKVLYVKESYGKTFAITDGGMHHHAASTFRGRIMKNNYPYKIINMKENTQGDIKIDVTGCLCTPEDILLRNISVKSINPGDLVCILKSGAYGLSFSPTTFLSHSLPSEIITFNNKEYLIRKSVGDHIFAGQIKKILRMS